MKHTITLIPGDGVGPEITEATKRCIEATGVDIVRRALEGPCHEIAENAGFNGSVIVQKTLQEKGNIGFNVIKGEFTDLVKDGVIDPAKVLCIALVSAASMSSLFITTETIISDKPEKGNWLYTPGGKMVILIRSYQSNPEKIGDYVPPAFVKK